MVFYNYQEIKTILLLFKSDLSEENNFIKSIIKKIEADGKKVSACGFLDKKETQSLLFPEYIILTKADVSFLGKPKNKIIENLLDKQYDVVIDLSLESIIPLSYLLIEAKSLFRVGRKRKEQGLIDFSIDIATKKDNHTAIDEKYLFEQIIFYLKNIQSHN